MRSTTYICKQLGVSQLEAYVGYEMDLDKFWKWYRERMALLRESKTIDDEYEAEARYLLFVGMRFNFNGAVGPTHNDLAIAHNLSPSRVAQILNSGLESVRLAAKKHDDIDWAIRELEYGY